MLRLKIAFLTTAMIALWVAPCLAYVTPSRVFTAALAFDVYAPTLDDLSGFDLDVVNWLLPQALKPNNNPFCTVPAGCRFFIATVGPGAAQYRSAPKLAGFRQFFSNSARSQYTGRPVPPHVDGGGLNHFGAMMGVPIFGDSASVVPAVRVASGYWTRASGLVGPVEPLVSVETQAIPASSDPDSLNYAVVFVASSFTSATQEDVSAWYLLPYAGSRRPHVVLRNYGTAPIYIVAAGIAIGLGDAASPRCRTNPVCPENTEALDGLNETAFPAPGLSGSTMMALDPQAPQILAPSDTATVMDWSQP